MNHLDFRRRIAAEPLSHDADLMAHRDGCEACMAVWQRAQRFEHVLGEAMSVPMPEGLIDRVLLAQATVVRRRHGVRRRGLLALAATLVITVAAGGFGWRYVDGLGLPALAVSHMSVEMASLSLTDTIPTAEVDAGFAGRDVALRGPMPKGVTYVHDCFVGTHRAVHVVTMQGGEPVVALYIPGQRIPARQEFARDGWNGREVPMHDGALVVLARTANQADLDAVEGNWMHAIDGVGENLLTRL
jgi:hypothetical protein